MTTTKIPELTARLPATPCKPTLRQAIVDFAVHSNRSLAEVQREAFELFLAKNDTFRDKKVLNGNITSIMAQSAPVSE